MLPVILGTDVVLRVTLGFLVLVLELVLVLALAISVGLLETPLITGLNNLLRAS